jgi:hypothetical protein
MPTIVARVFVTAAVTDATTFGQWMAAKQEKALPPITFDDLIAGAPVPDAVLPHLSQLVQIPVASRLGVERTVDFT